MILISGEGEKVKLHKKLNLLNLEKVVRNWTVSKIEGVLLPFHLEVEWTWSRIQAYWWESWRINEGKYTYYATHTNHVCRRKSDMDGQKMSGMKRGEILPHMFTYAEHTVFFFFFFFFKCSCHRWSHLYFNVSVVSLTHTTGTFALRLWEKLPRNSSRRVRFELV